MGTSHGWGVCGRYITRELARMAPVRLITDRLEADLVGGDLERPAVRALLAPEELLQSWRPLGVEHPVLQGVPGPDLAPMRPRLRGRRNVVYTFLENTPSHTAHNAQPATQLAS